MQADTVDMQNDNLHLDSERFASFDYDAPTTDELAHLAGCAACRSERQAFVALQAMSRAMAAPAAPDAPRLVEWEQLAGDLRREGLLTSPPVADSGHDDARLSVRAIDVAPRHTSADPMRRVTPAWLRIAAALTLTAGGALLGRFSADMSTASTSGGTSAVSVANTGDDFGSVQQASEVLYRAQRDYERASLWLAANDTTVHDRDVYRARLAALDQMMAASRAALREAPQDPVLNQYFLSAYTAREATLQALGGALPVDKSLERY